MLFELKKRGSPETISEGGRKRAAGAELPPLFLCPGRWVLLVAAIIFAAEALVMVILSFLPPLSMLQEAFLDAALLVTFLSPIFYFLLFRPFRLHVSYHQQATEDVRRLSRELFSAAEEERRKLALDLHDEFGQALTLLQLDVEALKAFRPGDEEEWAQCCDRLSRRIQDLGAQVRTLSATLRPAALDGLGIVAALESLVTELDRQHPKLRIEFQTLGLRRRLSPEVEIVLFRIAQEAINNALKHAGARSIAVHLTASRPYVVLTVQDNGRGFEPSKVYPAAGPAKACLGLLGMRERVEAAGGTLQVTAAPGKGVTIRAQLPGAEEERHERHQGPDRG